MRSEGRWVSLHLCSFFACICNFYVFLLSISFYLLIFFCIPEYLMGKRLLHVDVGPVRPVDYAWNRHRPWPEAAVATTGGVAVAENLLAGGREGP